MSDKKDQRGMTQDGIFKMLTWRSSVLTDMFGLPPIDGDPIQQETHEPSERKLDRLYRLADGSFLNVEHQTSLSDKTALAERMIKYRLRVRSNHPVPAKLHQVVVYTGDTPRNRRMVPKTLDYDDRPSEGGPGILFSAPIRDLLAEPLDSFRATAKLDDAMLGILGPGRRDVRYQAEVADLIYRLEGESQRDAKVKFITVCVTVGLTVDQLIGETRMWIEDVKDNSIVREIVRVAGRDDREAAERRGLAVALATIGQARKLEVPEDFVDLLIRYADEDQLREMLESIDQLRDDVISFVRDHGVNLPGHAP